MFNSDQPIKGSEEDLLDRSGFASSLAEAILNYHNHESLVLGLYGDWGSGKTSLLNMVVERLKKDYHEKENPIVIHFNPWYYSNQQQLIAQFFKVISLKLGKEGKSVKIQEAGKIISTIGSLISVIPIPYVNIVSELGKAVGNTLVNVGKESNEDLEEIKGKLNEILQNEKQKIIIIIDDIDRLPDSEIRQVFRLVKAVADFNNTIYLLSFDRKAVVNALDGTQEGKGKLYLEKIVQVPFEIPKVTQNKIYNLLDAKIENSMKINYEEWDMVHLGNIFNSGIKYFFKTIRDVNRFINTISFDFELVRNEVNPIDFLAITAIKVFLPEIYSGIRDNKDLFCGVIEYDISEFEEKRNIQKTELENMLNNQKIIKSEYLKGLLSYLFPRTEDVLKKQKYSHSYYNEYRKKLRICIPEIFDIYFRLSLPGDELSQIEIKVLIESTKDEKEFRKMIEKLTEKNKILLMLERLEDYTSEDIPEENIDNIISVLVDLGDTFPEDKRKGFFVINKPMRIMRIIYQLLHRIEDRNKRYEILKRAFTNANNSLNILVEEASVQEQGHEQYKTVGKDELPQEITLRREQLDDLIIIALDKIKSWAKDGRLDDHINLIYILYRWKRWGEVYEVRNYVESLIDKDIGLVQFITGFLRESTSFSGSDLVSKINWGMKIIDIEDFVNIEEIESRIRKIYDSEQFHTLKDRQKKAIQIFIDTIDGKVSKRY